MNTYRRNPWFLVTAICCLLLITQAQAGTGKFEKRTFTPQTSCTNCNPVDFWIYIPNAYTGSQSMPMVMVLHGRQQNSDNVVNHFGWDEQADQHGFILVAPNIAQPGTASTWRYWDDNQIHQGRGEVEALHQIGQQVENEWKIDACRRHIAGFCSGGFMANAAAVAHDEYWASAGVHSGGGYQENIETYNSGDCETPREASGTFKSPTTIAASMQAEMNNSSYKTPVMLMHSRNDCFVGYGEAGGSMQWGGLTSNREAWLIVNAGSPVSTTDCSRDGIACDHQKFGNTDRSTVETISFMGLIQGTDLDKGHYWSGGEVNAHRIKIDGPKAAALFWDFFNRHPRNDGQCPGSPRPAAPTNLTISKTAN